MLCSTCQRGWPYCKCGASPPIRPADFRKAFRKELSESDKRTLQREIDALEHQIKSLGIPIRLFRVDGGPVRLVMVSLDVLQELLGYTIRQGLQIEDIEGSN